MAIPGCCADFIIADHRQSPPPAGHKESAARMDGARIYLEKWSLFFHDRSIEEFVNDLFRYLQMLKSNIKSGAFKH